MKVIVLLGAPGAGKGTQAIKIEQKTGLRHLSTGEMLRAEVESGTELGKSIAGTLEKGSLVSDDIIIAIIEGCIKGEQCPKCPGLEECRAGFILDGFPRTVNQAQALERMMKEQGRQVDAVVLLDVEESTLAERIETRVRESDSDTARADDTISTLKNRLRIYNQRTMPLISFYEERGQLRRVDGMKPIDEVTQDVYDAITGDRARTLQSA
jgi:adenylate kinase